MGRRTPMRMETAEIRRSPELRGFGGLEGGQASGVASSVRESSAVILVQCPDWSIHCCCLDPSRAFSSRYSRSTIVSRFGLGPLTMRRPSLSRIPILRSSSGIDDHLTTSKRSRWYESGAVRDKARPTPAGRSRTVSTDWPLAILPCIESTSKTGPPRSLTGSPPTPGQPVWLRKLRSP